MSIEADTGILEQKELHSIQQVARQHAQPIDAVRLCYKASRDPYGILMAVVRDLKAQGWTSSWICGENGTPTKHITVFPPRQKQEPRGLLLPKGGGARRYTIYMTKG